MSFTAKRLNYFIAVAQSGSITRAAEKLYITPSPLSKRIKELEDELNVVLFHRNNKGLTLTEEGDILYQSVVELHDRINNIKNIKKKTRKIIIGVHGLCHENIEKTIIWLRENCEIKNIEIRKINESDIKNKAYLDTNILFSIYKLEPCCNWSTLISQDELAILSSRKNNNIQNLPFIQTSYFKQTTLWKDAHNQLIDAGFDKNIMTVDNIDTCLGIIRSNYAISLVAKSLLNHYDKKEFILHDVNLLNKNLNKYIYINSNLSMSIPCYLEQLNATSTISWEKIN